MFYLRLISDEVTIRNFHDESSVKKSTIKALRRNVASPKSLRQDISWEWSSECVCVQVSDLEGEIEAYLSGCRSIVDHLNRYRDRCNWMSLVIVIKYSEGEFPRGFYFSTKLISLLYEFGVDVDIDAVHDLDYDESTKD